MSERDVTPLGRSPAFLDAQERLSRIAGLDRPILVIGERGCGKELAAARLHYLSGRWRKPLVRVNCAALPETLLESELFGHEAGAFTGAARRRLGRFEQADGGTLFLDEIAAASDAVQERLLRAVEYGEFDRVGGDTVKVDVRLVAATNADLPVLAAAGRFRADLLDRLAFDVVTLPPLRARADDIPLLAEHFAMEMVKELRRPYFPGFTPEAMRTLEAYDWPGNVRQLRNVVQRAVAGHEADEPVARIALDPFASPWRPAPIKDIQPAPTHTTRTPAPEPPVCDDFTGAVAAFERGLLAQALTAAKHNQRRAAAALKLSYHQFRGHLRRHGLIGTGGEGRGDRDGGGAEDTPDGAC
jgi:psp operon transcriptional activator